MQVIVGPLGSCWMSSVVLHDPHVWTQDSRRWYKSPSALSNLEKKALETGPGQYLLKTTENAIQSWPSREWDRCEFKQIKLGSETTFVQTWARTLNISVFLYHCDNVYRWWTRLLIVNQHFWINMVPETIKAKSFKLFLFFISWFSTNMAMKRLTFTLNSQIWWFCQPSTVNFPWY